MCVPDRHLKQRLDPRDPGQVVPIEAVAGVDARRLGRHLVPQILRVSASCWGFRVPMRRSV